MRRCSTRQDPTIDFVWGEGSPDPALPGNGFSVRWTKTQYFGAGRYRFTAVADDGVRLYIDGKRVIDQWLGPANTEFSYVADLGEGMHTIRMEYFELRRRRAGRRSTGTACPTSRRTPSGREYWNTPPGVNAIPGTSPELARDEEAIDHDWGEGSPGPGIGTEPVRGPLDAHDDLRARRLRVRGDGRRRRAAVRRRRAGDRPVDRPGPDHLPHDAATGRRAAHHRHGVLRERRRRGGPAERTRAVGDPPADSPVPGAVLEHARRRGHPRPSRPGPPDLERDDETLDFDWGDGSPAPAIAPDRFVARWTKTVTLSAGVYRFSGARDDGMRVYVDDVPVVDRWTFGNAAFSVDKVVAGGTHDLRVEHFEAGGGARAEFDLRADRRRRGRATAGTPPSTSPTATCTGTPALTRRTTRSTSTGAAARPATACPPTTSRLGGPSR